MKRSKHLYRLSYSLLLTLILTACGSGSSNDPKKGERELFDYSVELTSIKIVLSAPVVNSGNSITATAYGDYSNGTSNVLLEYVQWFPTGDYTIDPNGVITAGEVTTNTSVSIVASFEGVGSLSLPFRIVPRPQIPVASTLVSISLLPASLRPLNQGETVQLSAIGKYSDGTAKNLTRSVVWSSADSTIASVTNSTTALLSGGDISTGTQSGTVSITATLGTTTQSVSVQSLPALVSIQLSAPATVRVGDPVNIQATGTYADNTTQSIKNSVLWTSSNKNAIDITQTGHVSVGNIGGSSTISASFNAISASTTINFVIPQSIRIDTNLTNLTPNSITRLRVSAVNSATSIVDISNRAVSTVVDTAIADIRVNQSNVSEVTAFFTVGNTVVNTSAFGLPAQRNLNVISTSATAASLKFVDLSISMISNTQYTPQLQAIDANGLKSFPTQNVTWEVVDTSVATINASGVITAASIATNTAVTKLVATYQGIKAETYIYVNKPAIYDYLNYTVDSNPEVSQIENTFLIYYASLGAAISTTGVLNNIPTKVLKPNYYFMTMTNPLSDEKLAFGIDTSAGGNYNKTNATLIYVKNKNNPEFYTLDISLNTSLTATVVEYGIVGGKTSGSFTATLCKASAIDAGTCASAGNTINISGNYIMSVDNELPSTCYPSSMPKLIDAYTKKSSQLICNGVMRSYYQLDTVKGTTYNITATSAENISILAEGSASVAGNVSFTATKSLSDISFDYTGANINHAFRLDVVTVGLGNEGTLNNPKIIGGNTIPINGTMIVDNTTSYYKIAATNGYRYLVKFAGDKLQGTGLVVSLSANGLFDATNICTTPGTNCPIAATSGFIYIKLDGTVSGAASIDATMNYQTDRDPVKYDDTYNLTYPVTNFKGQVGKIEPVVYGLQGSAYGIEGLAASTKYVIKLSGVENLARLWVNAWGQGQGGQGQGGEGSVSCQATGTINTGPIYCYFQTPATFPIGFTVSVTAGAIGTKFQLDVSETTDTLYYVSTFENSSTFSTIKDVNEIALYRTPYVAGVTKPFVVSASDNSKYTSNIFSAAVGEQIFFQVTDVSVVGGNAYSIIVNTTGNTIKSVNSPIGPDVGETGGSNNSASGATALTLDTAVDNTFINADGSITNDQDWFSFTAP